MSALNDESTTQPLKTTAACSGFYTARSVAVPLAAALLTSVAYSFAPMLGLLCFAVLAVAWVVWTLANVYRLVIAVRLRRWRRACELAAITVCSGPAMAALMVIPGDYIHLAIVYPSYRAEILHDHSRPYLFGWGGVGGSQRALAYDDLGTLKAQVGTTNLDEGIRRTTQHLVGDFYVVEISW